LIVRTGLPGYVPLVGVGRLASTNVSVVVPTANGASR
jgi:hypothetical protein